MRGWRGVKEVNKKDKKLKEVKEASEMLDKLINLQENNLYNEFYSHIVKNLNTKVQELLAIEELESKNIINQPPENSGSAIVMQIERELLSLTFVKLTACLKFIKNRLGKTQLSVYRNNTKASKYNQIISICRDDYLSEEQLHLLLNYIKQLQYGEIKKGDE